MAKVELSRTLQPPNSHRDIFRDIYALLSWRIPHSSEPFGDPHIMSKQRTGYVYYDEKRKTWTARLTYKDELAGLATSGARSATRLKAISCSRNCSTILTSTARRSLTTPNSQVLEIAGIGREILARLNCFASHLQPDDLDRRLHPIRETLN